jgi:hypothetical protein
MEPYVMETGVRRAEKGFGVLRSDPFQSFSDLFSVILIPIGLIKVP